MDTLTVSKRKLDTLRQFVAANLVNYLLENWQNRKFVPYLMHTIFVIILFCL